MEMTKKEFNECMRDDKKFNELISQLEEKQKQMRTVGEHYIEASQEVEEFIKMIKDKRPLLAKEEEEE